VTPFLQRAALAVAGCALLAGGAWLATDETPLEELRIESDDHWPEAGFVEMVSPISPPTSADRDDVIQVWLRLPPSGEVGLAIGADGRPALTLPAGTVADRVERHLTPSGSRVIDVRGTELEAGGGQRFRLLRRSEGGLRGFAWERGAAEQQAEADRRIAELVPSRAVGKLRALNDCARCHFANKSEEVTAGERFTPNRRTDAVGFYQVQAVFDDEQPLERTRPYDTNVGRQFVTLSCMRGGEPRLEHGQGHPSCADGSTPRARYDVAAARVAGDARALGVCAAREYLGGHMSSEARVAFAAALEACDLDDETTGRREAGLDTTEKETTSWKRRASK